MAIIQDHPGDVELYEVLPPEYFEELVESAQAEQERLNQASKLLEDGDLLCYHVENARRHLDSLIAGWRADAQRAALRLS